MPLHVVCMNVSQQSTAFVHENLARKDDLLFLFFEELDVSCSCTDCDEISCS